MIGEIPLSSVNVVMRNKNRILNHMPLAKQKAAIIRKLGLCEDSTGWPESKNLLTGLMQGEMMTKDAVKVIHNITGITEELIRKDLLFCYRTGLLEFHATDVCDLNCVDCHYRQKAGATLPFTAVGGYLKNLQPRAVTVTGGGEPNLYRSEGNDLNTLILYIHEEHPELQIGLINNNTAIPEGNWYNCLSWQRTSVDAQDASTYLAIKGKNKYDACIKNVYRFLNSEIPYVGIGFLYRRENIAGMKDFLTDWAQRRQRMNSLEKSKFNIQFRPISPAIDQVYRYDTDNELERQTSEMIAGIRRYAGTHDDFDAFLRECTNFYSIEKHDNSFFLHERKPFHNCYNALLHRVLRADGSEYPDFLLCNDPAMALGNVQTAEDADDERMKIALCSFYFFNRLSVQTCNEKICRQCWVSNLIENNRDTDISNMNLPDSYFF